MPQAAEQDRTAEEGMSRVRVPVMNHAYPCEAKGRGQSHGLSGLVSVSEGLWRAVFTL